MGGCGGSIIIVRRRLEGGFECVRGSFSGVDVKIS